MHIRKAKPEDSTDIATLLLLAMEDIVYEFIGESNHQRAKELMLYFTARENNQYSYENCWVAQHDGRILGAVNVYDGARLNQLREPVIQYVQRIYGKKMDPEDETQLGEYYIDTLGVSPDFQGTGVGTQLLQFLIEELVDKQKQTIGLLVDEINPKAKKLYLRLGFESMGHKILVGKKMEHLQVRSQS